jgi:hypothetical protein
MNTAIELLIRILCNTRPDGPADGAYLYCTTVDSQSSIFQTARLLISQAAAARYRRCRIHRRQLRSHLAGDRQGHGVVNLDKLTYAGNPENLDAGWRKTRTTSL